MNFSIKHTCIRNKEKTHTDTMHENLVQPFTCTLAKRVEALLASNKQTAL